MKKCVFGEFCVSKSAYEDLSEEHIIPNSIGGMLKSSNLLCEDCNSWLGDNIDIAFDGPYNNIMNFFNIKRDRGDSNPALMVNEEGHEYFITSNGQPKLKSVIIKNLDLNIGRFEMSLQGPLNKKAIINAIGKHLSENKENLEQAGTTYKEAINRCHEFINEHWNEIRANVISEKPGKLKEENSLGGKNIYLGILKILYLFLKYTDNSIIFNESTIINSLKNKEDVTDKCFAFGVDSELFEYPEKQIGHFLAVKSYPEENKILGFIELFSLTPYVCILDDNYTEGKSFQYAYGYDLLNNAIITVTCNFLESSFNLKNNFEYKKIFNIYSNKISTNYSKIISNYQECIWDVLEMKFKEVFGDTYNKMDFLHTFIKNQRLYFGNMRFEEKLLTKSVKS
jgi:hypothetical protein